VTKGGLGKIGLASADEIGGAVTLIFSQPICAGQEPGTGDTSFFIGLASSHPPKAVQAEADVGIIVTLASS
jgi:hypothetical protein